MRLLLLTLSLTAVAWVRATETATDHDKEQWELFKIKYEKKYESEKEDNFRRAIFIDNLQLIRDHNARYKRGEETFIMATNKFADMTREEWRQQNGFRLPQEHDENIDWFNPKPFSRLPDSFDWRQHGAVTPVKNQGYCGSCWAFATVGSIEGAWFLKTKKLVSLSEQNLVDCSKNYGNEGCKGGYPVAAFKYIVKNEGIDTEQSYPYEDREWVCRYTVAGKGAVVTGYVRVRNGSDEALQQALASQGPVTVSIDATDAFMFYGGGVFTDNKCSSEYSRLNHAVTLIGYGTEHGQDYWLIKNSWGTHWGEDGYVRMSRAQHNICGIATDACYPKV